MRERNGIASGMEAVSRMERDAGDAVELVEMAVTRHRRKEGFA